MLIAPLWALLNSAAEWLFLVPLLPFLQRRSGNENRPGFAVSRERPAKTLWRHGTDRLLFDRRAGAAGARGRTIRERRLRNHRGASPIFVRRDGPVFSETTGKVEDVGKLAPEAGYLLTAAFPYLNLKQADAILTATEGPGGGFLDNGSAFGIYSRLSARARVFGPRCTLRRANTGFKSSRPGSCGKRLANGHDLRPRLVPGGESWIRTRDTVFRTA